MHLSLLAIVFCLRVFCEALHARFAFSGDISYECGQRAMAFDALVRRRLLDLSRVFHGLGRVNIYY
jgi:hypothetical protein